MFKSYLKLALRNIKRHKAFTIINTIGLAVGIACSFIILLWVWDEFSYDKFHSNGDQIYRVIGQFRTEQGTFAYAKTPPGMAPLMKETYPEVVDAVRFQSFDHWLVQYGEKFFENDRLGTADTSFFEMFSFPFLKGDAKTALNDRYSIVLTERMAKKYFGDEDPMGKIMKIGGNTDFKVTGILKDVPFNSHMQFDCIFPIINMERFWGLDMRSWQQFRLVTYIQLQKNASPGELSRKVRDLARDYLPVKQDIAVIFQPLQRVHLYSTYREDEDNVRKGSILIVYIFSLLAFWIFLVACINSVNLSTALSGTRAREVGMRKVAGALRTDLIKQFIGESFVLTIFALFLGIILVYLFLPVFNNLAGKQLTFALDFSANLQTLISLVGLVILTGLVSGSYPAFLLSAFQPVQVLKADVGRRKPRGLYLQKILVVFQFTITAILLIATIVVYSQINYINNKDLGFDRENVVYFRALGKYEQDFEAAKSILLQNPNILDVTRSWPPSSSSRDTIDVDWEGKNPGEKVVLHPFSVDHDFASFFNTRMADGRFFSRKFPTDASNYVLNETAVRTIGLQAPMGKWFSYRGVRGTIIGVMKDFHQGSLHRRIKPLILTLTDGANSVCVKIKPGNTSETLHFLENKWKEFVGGQYPFVYRFLNETINNYYGTERKIGTLFRAFTILAILISCLGLFGLASYITRRQTRQIGIRKILGASVTNITLLFTNTFTRWVLIANLIAWPIGWFGMNKLLELYAYRISIGWWIFLVTGVATLAIALLTVIFQVVKAARTNPVEVIKYE